MSWVNLYALIGILSVLAAGSASAHDTCVPVGAWVEPASGKVISHRDMIGRLSGDQKGVVLLGEAHNRRAHHRWQLQTLAALFAHRSDMAIGFEMLPREAQPVLDKWVAGKLSAHELLVESRWNEVWGVDPSLYMPLLDFARMNRLRALALNVPREFVRRVGDEGWESIPDSERQGLTDPVPASDAYRERLKNVYVHHLEEGHAARENPDTVEDDDPKFEKFIQVQLTWDRAFAQTIAEAQGDPDVGLIVGIIGSGHLDHGDGVPRQLAQLGVSNVSVLLPWETNRDCSRLTADLADAVFGLDPPPAHGSPHAARRSKPRLGVRIHDSENGVRVIEVIAGSVAQNADIRADDVIARAAGLSVSRTGELIAIVQRQAPGTWLPLVVKRDGQDIAIIAKFPIKK